MSVRQKYKVLSYLLPALLLLFAYQNCGYIGPSEKVMLNQLSSSSFSSIESKIFSARCTQCHSGATPSAGYDLSSYAGVMSGGRVVAYDPASSKLMQRISDGSMPPSGSPLSSAEIQNIRTWISTGALSAEGTVTPTPTPTTNSDLAPIVSAGTNRTITLPLASVSFAGSAIDKDGTVVALQWSKLSGPTATLNNATTTTLIVSSLNAGTYVFEFKATDDKGISGTATVQLVVNPAPNVAPVANAGADLSITLPANSATINGSGTDSDGTIASYGWTQVSGPSTATLVGASTAALRAQSLSAGTYVFRLTVTDNSGATGTDNMQVFVNAAGNVAPVANAGADQTITLPTNSVSLSGTATDSGGSIASVLWSQVSGPSTATNSSASTLSTQMQNLVAGTYVFQLKATDNMGAIGTDNISIIVNSAANVLPTASAGADSSVSLPTNSVTLSGSGADSDGTISSYAWTQVSGPSTATMSGANSNILTASNLVQGVYVFQIRVTDNSGGQATDQAQVSVLADTTATFSWISANVLQPKCVSCHGGSNPDARYSLENYTNTLKNVVSGNSGTSQLYLKVFNNSMPKGGSSLSTAQKDAIKRWIDNGAANN